MNLISTHSRESDRLWKCIWDIWEEIHWQIFKLLHKKARQLDRHDRYRCQLKRLMDQDDQVKEIQERAREKLLLGDLTGAEYRKNQFVGKVSMRRRKKNLEMMKVIRDKLLELEQ